MTLNDIECQSAALSSVLCGIVDCEQMAEARIMQFSL